MLDYENERIPPWFKSEKIMNLIVDLGNDQENNDKRLSNGRNRYSRSKIFEKLEMLEERGLVNYDRTGEKNISELTEKGQDVRDTIETHIIGTPNEDRMMKYSISEYLDCRNASGKDNKRKQFKERVRAELGTNLRSKSLDELKDLVDILWDEVWKEEKKAAGNGQFTGEMKKQIEPELNSS